MNKCKCNLWYIREFVHRGVHYYVCVDCGVKKEYSRVCARNGCFNVVVGRKDKKYCSNACGSYVRVNKKRGKNRESLL